MTVKLPANDEKEKEDNVSATPLLRYLRKEIKMFVAATLFMVGSNIGQLVIPLFVGMFIDLIT